jgi:hypothetical protein
MKILKYGIITSNKYYFIKKHLTKNQKSTYFRELNIKLLIFS